MSTKTTSERKPAKSMSHWGVARDALVWAVGTDSAIFLFLRFAPEWGAALRGGPVNPYTTFVELLPIFFATFYLVLHLLSKLP